MADIIDSTGFAMTHKQRQIEAAAEAIWLQPRQYGCSRGNMAAAEAIWLQPRQYGLRSPAEISADQSAHGIKCSQFYRLATARKPPQHSTQLAE
jgi:hypothetical protein